MKVSEKELLHIVKLANLQLKDEEVEKYLLNLQDILDMAENVSEVKLEGIEENILSCDKFNVFHKDEQIKFENQEEILENAPEKEMNMFKIPKVIQ